MFKQGTFSEPGYRGNIQMGVPSEYMYDGITAELYDLWFDKNKSLEDVEFYRRRIANNRGLALEVGSGTGRLLLSYLRDGFNVHGVEPSFDMISVCEQKAQSLGLQPKIYQQSMEGMKTPDSYNTIYVPFCTFQLLVNRLDVHEALRRFYVHLNEGGELLVSLVIPDYSYSHQGMWNVVRSATRPESESKIVLSEAVQYDCFNQIQLKWIKYDVYDKDHKLADSFLKMMQQRWYYPNEFRMVLEKAGFRDISIYGDYADKPADDTSDIFIFSARK